MANDKDLWSHVSETVDPLVDRKLVYSEFLENLSDRQKAWTRPAAFSKPKVRLSGAMAAVTPPKKIQLVKPALPLLHGQSAGLDKRQEDRLKKGRLSVEAKLDLHGLSQQEAHRDLNDFIEGQWSLARRCVLVVTGKGKGILQNAVPQWLNQPPVYQRIVSFTYAQPKDGGRGALYILLKRNPTISF